MRLQAFFGVVVMLLQHSAVAQVGVPSERDLRARFAQYSSRYDSATENFEKTKRRALAKKQGVDFKNWREAERKARRKFFDENHSGPKRRAYVQDYLKRKKNFEFDQAVQWTEFHKEMKQYRQNRKEKKDLKKAELENYIRVEQAPIEEFWKDSSF